MKKLSFLPALLVALAIVNSWAPAARAQLSNAQVVSSCGGLSWTAGTIRNLSQDTTGKACVAATATATFTGFTPTGNATLTTSGTSARVALPSADTTALVRNTGTVDEWINFGNSSVTATTSNTLVPAGQAIAFTIPGGATYIAGITGGSAGSLAVSTGTGSPVMTGGGSGGGGGGAITAASGAYASGSISSGAIASGAVASGAISSGAVASGAYAAGALAAGAGVDGWDLTQGAKADSACASDNGTCSLAALIKRTNQNLTTVNTSIGGSIPAGTNIIGKVGIDQTTDGTTNAVHLVAGTAIAGKFGIDQTTDGTTNAVHLVAGTALVGQVALAPQTSGGLTNYVLEPAASDNHANIKNGAGQVYGVHVFNNSATINYGRLYNAASGFNGCNSATNLIYEFQIPASTSGAGFVVPIPEGLAFSTGISICVTGAYGQTNTTNATASAISLNVLYK